MEIKHFRTTDQKNTIIAVIHREDPNHPWVVSKITAHSLDFNEWCNGRYFKTYYEAMTYFKQK